MERADKRAYNELRPVTFQAGIAPHSTGSVLVSFGDTKVICSAMIEERVPGWMKYQNVSGGWLTAEYNMLPYSTLDRKQRDSSRGKVDGRSTEIQRLIGRSLRAVVDLKALGQRTIWIDCDVLQADGGTRTASITGGCVAAAIAFNRLLADGKIKKSPLKQLLAAVSAGVVNESPLLDLCYTEDRDASVDFNVVMTDKLDFVELQGSGEEAVFTPAQLTDMLDLAKKGVEELIEAQRKAIGEAEEAADSGQLMDLASHFSK
ncbi:MAG: ribonuclease PH [Verrucomicrobiales bacterium]|jgi:ribonuclease PH